ncbi:MAG: 4Fe-4S binding protein [Anaerolineae bacterium]|nr:4Fe-4S binding protein [Anaerolineae bacterium]MDW8102713.1 4Fe-4S binding protein [Anaerolineae bacterium]
MKLKVDQNLCIKCGMCAAACPCGALILSEEGLQFNCPSDCSLYLLGGPEFFFPCEEACPTGALSLAFEIASLKGG